MQRHDTSLSTHADQRRQRNADLQSGPGPDDAGRSKRPRMSEQQDRYPRPNPTKVSDRDVDEDATTRLRVSVAMKQDDHGRQQTHQFPTAEERDGVAGTQQPRHRQHEHPGQRTDHSPTTGAVEVAGGVRQRRCGNQTEGC